MITFALFSAAETTWNPQIQGKLRSIGIKAISSTGSVCSVGFGAPTQRTVGGVTTSTDQLAAGLDFGVSETRFEKPIPIALNQCLKVTIQNPGGTFLVELHT